MFARTTERVLERAAVASAVRTPLSLSKVQILRLLHRGGSRTSTQLAHFLNVSKPAVTQIVDSMVGGKLVKRSPAADDRRKVELTLTRKGVSAFLAIRHRQREVMRLAIDRCGDRKTAAWADTLCALSDALSGTDSSAAPFCLQCEAFIDGECILSTAEIACPYHEQAASNHGAGPAVRPAPKARSKKPASRGRSTPAKRKTR